MLLTGQVRWEPGDWFSNTAVIPDLDKRNVSEEMEGKVMLEWDAESAEEIETKTPNSDYSDYDNIFFYF